MRFLFSNERAGGRVSKVKKNRIEKQNYKTIEAELYCYKATLRELAQMRADIINSSPSQEVSVQSSSLGDTTANKAIKLSSSLEIIEVERRIKAIEEAIKIIEKDPIKMELLRLKYFESKYTDIGIMECIGISQRTFYRYKTEIIKIVGLKLGWRV